MYILRELNSFKPLCNNCIYFKPYYIKDGIYELDSCMKFWKLNIKSGKIIYEYTSLARIKEYKCGENGTHFVQNEII